MVIKNFLNPKGHQNPISGSKVTAILMKGRILPIGGASSGEGLRLQPAQQACFIKKLIFMRTSIQQKKYLQIMNIFRSPREIPINRYMFSCDWGVNVFRRYFHKG